MNILLGQLLPVLDTIIVSIWIHEFGHALTALILTRESVTVSIGDYWNGERFVNSKHRLTVKIVGWRWWAGHCSYEHTPANLNTKIFITAAAGPLASLLLVLTLTALSASGGLTPIAAAVATWPLTCTLFMTDGPKLLALAEDKQVLL